MTPCTTRPITLTPKTKLAIFTPEKTTTTIASIPKMPRKTSLPELPTVISEAKKRILSFLPEYRLEGGQIGECSTAREARNSHADEQPTELLNTNHL
jgi:hypothetical protein